MSEVRVNIPIKVGYHGESYLLVITFDMDFLPSVGDVFHPLKNDLDSGLSFEVGSRYWTEKGKAVLQVGQYIIDPPEVGTPLPRTWHAWWSDQDGDLVELLLTNGWHHYNPVEDDL